MKTKLFVTTMARLFEMLLQEASKARFINQIWDELEDDPEAAMNLTNYKTNFLPSADAITKWVDSGAANSFLQKTKFNWQNFAAGKDDANGIPLYVTLLNAFFDYKDAGGSRKERQEYKKKNPYEVFKQSGLKVIQSGEQDPSADMVLLPELENEDYVFVVPLNWEACKFMDSFECGGAGAKWCIGYEKSDAYFRDYTEEGYLFVLAFRKTQTPVKDEIKYMIELSKQNWMKKKVWRQDDDEGRTIPESQYEEMFGWDHSKMLKVFDRAVLSWRGNVYSDNDALAFQHKGFNINNLDGYRHETWEEAVMHNHEVVIDCGGQVVNEDFDIGVLVQWLAQEFGEDIRYTLKLRNGNFKHLEFTITDGRLPQELFITEEVNVDRMDCSNYAFNFCYIVGDCIQNMFVDGEETHWPPY